MKLTKGQINEWANENLEMIEKAAEESMFGMSDEGFCLSCDASAMGVEPDATYRECECCGERMVFGAQELIFYITG